MTDGHLSTVARYLRLSPSPGGVIGFAVIALGLTVLLGWRFESIEIIQLKAGWSPMGPNAAVAFGLCGGALVGLWLGRNGWAITAGAGAAVIGAATGLEVLLGVDFGIDWLLIEPFAIETTTHPARMHPLTSFAFVLAGLGLLASGLRSPPRIAFLFAAPSGLVLLVFGSMVQLAYAADLGELPGWRELTRVALHTSLGFSLLGAALLSHGWIACVRAHEPLPLWSAWVAGVLVAAISLLFWRALDQREHSQVDFYLNAEADAIKTQMSAAIESRITALIRMKERWEKRGGMPQAEWEMDAANIVRDQAGYQAITWVDADYRFRWVKPIAGNERLLQYDLRVDPLRRREFETARQTRNIVLTDRMELVQGNHGFTTILPIFVGDEFQGFIHASFRYDRLFVPILAKNDDEGVGVSLRHGNTEVLSTTTAAADHTHPDFARFSPYGQDFSISVWATPRFGKARSILHEIVLASGLIVALLLVAFLRAADRARMRLDHSERHFRNIVEQSLQGILVATDKILFVNDAHCRMFGYSVEEFVALPSLLDCYHPDDRDMLRSLGDAVMRCETTTPMIEIRGIRKDGGAFWLQQMCSRVEWRGTSAVQIMTLDVTERKLAEQRLKESEKQYRETFENAPVAMTWIAPDGTFITTNHAFREILGYTSDELRSMKRGDVIHPKFAEQRDREIKQCFGGGLDRLIAELQLVRKDGTAIWTLISTCLLRDEDGIALYIISHIQDITESKLSEEKLFQAQKMEALGNFAGGIAHDFNNMLLPIVALTEITKDDLPPESPLQENLEAVLQAASQASKLVRQILTFSRQDEHEVAALDISHCVSGAIELLRNVLPASITVTRTVQPDAGIVMGDRAQLNSVIMNLGSNAADAMSGKVGHLDLGLARVTADVTLTTRVPDLVAGRAYARISIRDTGCGMDEATKEKIFNPFFTTKAPGEGTGLGLAMVHGIIERHSGAIDVTSALGVGTTFDIYLPLEEAGGQAASTPMASAVDRLVA